MFKQVTILFFVCVLYYNWDCVAAKSDACANYDLKVNHIKHCSGSKKDSNIKHINMTFHLTPDCKFKPSGCFILRQGFTKASCHYMVNHPPLFKKEDDMDICADLEDDKMKNVRETYQAIKKGCPFAKNKPYCFNDGSYTDISEHAGKLKIACGPTTVQMKYKFDNPASTACLDASLVITDKSRG